MRDPLVYIYFPVSIKQKYFRKIFKSRALQEHDFSRVSFGFEAINEFVEAIEIN